jgi:hypothetical protein
MGWGYDTSGDEEKGIEVLVEELENWKTRRHWHEREDNTEMYHDERRMEDVD